MLLCRICLIDYDTAESKPVVGTCGHTICYGCSLKIHGKCPTCRKDSFRSPVTNFQILEQIEMEKENGNDRKHEKAEHRVEQLIKLNLSNFQSMSEGMEELQSKMDLMRKENREIKEDVKKLRTKMDLLKKENQNVKGPKEEKATVPYKPKTKYQPSSARSRPTLDGSLQCSSCSCLLTLPLALRKDGVSVICICRCVNIVAAKEKGHKWMENYCLNGSCFRESCFQQWPTDAPENAPVNCPRCNYKAVIFNASIYEAKPAIQNDPNQTL